MSMGISQLENRDWNFKGNIKVNGTTVINSSGAIIGDIQATAGSISLTEMADLARGSIITGQTASNRPTALVAKSSGYILVGDGTDIASVAVSGDATLSSAGAVAVTKINGATLGTATAISGNVLIGSGTAWVTQSISGDATLAANGALTVGNNGQYVEVALSEANIVGMNAAPVEVIAAQAGKAIEIISAVLIYDYDTAAYINGGDVGLIYSGGVALTGVVSAANSLGAAADKISYLQPVVPTNNQLLSNTAVQITNATAPFADPGTAAGVARLQISYRTHTTGL